ncbi:ABC transporter ATP-binding protein [Candidatus Bathyarchaeota archaeon]|nr:MAG: ABC transporter ATP-binding protein [Candidatus Bathyarchaeota archaeon]
MKREASLLEVQNLTTYYELPRGYVKAAENINFNVKVGEALGLAGESGCGKTTVALSIVRLLPPEGRIMGGKCLFKGVDIVKLPEEEVRKKIRWKGISIVFQGAMNALNPVYRIGDQIVEAITTHEDVSEEEAIKRAEKLFELVGIDPSRLDNYPFEFSGGMRQRALIAMALACNPDLIIADEPGTALDVIVQAQVLKLLKSLKEKLNLAVIMISHDLSMIAETCDKIAIMYAGRIVEYGDIVKVFKRSLHPYTQGLIGAFPSIKGPRMRMISIPGSPPNLLNPPPGCRFHPRCKYAMDICRKEVPEFIEIEPEHWVACHLVSKK